MAIGPTDSISSVALVPGGRDAPSEVGDTSFGEELSKAVNAVDQLQVNADQQALKVAHGEGNLHETALALEKADVAMRVAMKVRNKLVDAYQEVMRMNI